MNKKQIRLTESELKQVIAESVRRVLREAYNTEEWQDAYLDKNGYIIQTRGTGPNTEWRTIKKNRPKIENKFNKPYDPEEWADAYLDKNGYIIQTRGTGPNTEWRAIKGKKH